MSSISHEITVYLCAHTADAGPPRVIATVRVTIADGVLPSDVRGCTTRPVIEVVPYADSNEHAGTVIVLHASLIGPTDGRTLPDYSVHSA